MPNTNWTTIMPKRAGPQSNTVSEVRIRTATIGFSGKVVADMGWSAGDHLQVDTDAASRRIRFRKADVGFYLRKPTNGPALVLNAPSIVEALKDWQGKYRDVACDGDSCIVTCETDEALTDA